MLTRYLISLYYSFASMTTTGYGDITAVNNVERIFTILLMFAGVTIFGYNLFLICVIIIEGNPQEIEMRNKMSEIEQFCHDRKLSLALQYRVRKHFKTYFLANENALYDNCDMCLYNTARSTPGASSS